MICPCCHQYFRNVNLYTLHFSEKHTFQEVEFALLQYQSEFKSKFVPRRTASSVKHHSVSMTELHSSSNPQKEFNEHHTLRNGKLYASFEESDSNLINLYEGESMEFEENENRNILNLSISPIKNSPIKLDAFDKPCSTSTPVKAKSKRSLLKPVEQIKETLVYVCHYCYKKWDNIDALKIHSEHHLKENILDDILQLENSYQSTKSQHDKLFKYFAEGFKSALNKSVDSNGNLKRRFLKFYLKDNQKQCDNKDNLPSQRHKKKK